MTCELKRLSRSAPGQAPEASLVFASSAHRQALAAIGRGIAQGSGLVEITGSEGSGKSMLAAYLRASLDRRRIEVADLAADPERNAELLQSWEGEQASAGRGLLLIDADFVPLAVLDAAIGQLITSTRPWLAVVFARTGQQTRLAAQHARLAASGRFVIRHHLGPVPAVEPRKRSARGVDLSSRSWQIRSSGFHRSEMETLGVAGR